MSKNWFITGASRKIGAQIVKAALAAGDRVIPTGRDPSRIRETFAGDTDRLLALRLDVTSERDARTAVAQATEHFGSIDVLVNNAGYGQFGAFEEQDSADAQRQFETNVFGLFNVTRAALEGMRMRRAGRIFNLSSIAGVRGGHGGTLYSASKFAVEGFSELLALKVAQFGIKVTQIRARLLPHRLSRRQLDALRHAAHCGLCGTFSEAQGRAGSAEP
jgi:NAD(P)-dependent dehydrogenase (short-subunit alcohol dehydrogenase family)